MRSTKILVLILCLLALAPCGSSTGGTETGNTQPVSLRPIGYQSSRFLQSAGMMGLVVGNLALTQAQMVLDQVTFRPASFCNTSGENNGASEASFAGPFVLDLLDPQIIPGLENLPIAPGQYCQLGLTFKELQFSVFLTGARADGTPFQMTAILNDTFDVNTPDGFSIEPSPTTLILFIAFDLDDWFQGVDLSDPSIEVSTGPDGNPIIYLSETQNPSAQGKIVENIQDSPDLFGDRNGNNNLDQDEQDNPL